MGDGVALGEVGSGEVGSGVVLGIHYGFPTATSYHSLAELGGVY